jgi:putative flippase GtrA
VGFATDYLVLRLGTGLGLSPAVARIVSLLCAMQVTFTINGLFVFRCLSWRKLPRQWGAYLATNGFGNVCNYWIFVTLISLHSSIWSDHLLALGVSSFFAWMINYLGTRFIAFRTARPHGPRPGPDRAASPSGQSPAKTSAP